MKTKEKLEAVNVAFNERLQQQIDGSLPKDYVYKLGYAGTILQSAGVPNLPVELSAERLATKSHEGYHRNHPFNLLDIKDLPNAIKYADCNF